MKSEPVSVRALLLILVAGLTLSSAGCVTGDQRAARWAKQIYRGMTQEEVRDALGEADVSVDAEGRQIWHYSYGSLPDPAKITATATKVLAILTVFGALMILIAYAGRDGGSYQGTPTFESSGPQIDGPMTSERGHFRVVFDRTGRVMEISGIGECEDDP